MDERKEEFEEMISIDVKTELEKITGENVNVEGGKFRENGSNFGRLLKCKGASHGAV